MRDMPATMVPVGTWSGYAEAGIGRDTNANVATPQGSIFVPSLGAELLIDRSFLRESDDFATLGAGMVYARPLNGSMAAILGADLHARSYAQLDTSDSLAADFRASLNQRLDAGHSVQYTLRHNDYQLDHASYRRMQSAGLEWRRTLGDRARVALGAEGYRIRYRKEELRVSSSDLAALAGSAAYVLDAATRSVGLASVFVGLDNAVAGRADGDRRIVGASATLQRYVAPRLQGYASVAFLDSRYSDTNLDFNVHRRDRQLDFAFGASWQLADGWFARPQIVRTRHASNIPVHDYGRTEVSLSLRREWQ
jgi:hypothetical protein